MACPKVEVLTPQASVGKGPHWDEATKSLYFVDMFQGTVHCYKPDTCKFYTATVGCGTDKPLAIIVPIQGQKESFIVSMKNDLSCIKWDGIASNTSEPKVIQSLEPNDNFNRINNGKVDPKCRLWAGTTGRALPSCDPDEPKFEEGVAALYMLNNSKSFTKLIDCVSVSNGTEWSSDNKKFFFTDSAKMVLDVYDYNHESGQISNRKPIFNIKKNNLTGLLDGMAISKSGKLYIANYLGYSVLVIDTNTCQLVNKIQIPSKQVTSCCWGGPENDILFVTTGNSEADPNCPNSGHVFKVTNLCDKGVCSRSAVI